MKPSDLLYQLLRELHDEDRVVVPAEPLHRVEEPGPPDDGWLVEMRLDQSPGDLEEIDLDQSLGDASETLDESAEEHAVRAERDDQARRESDELMEGLHMEEKSNQFVKSRTRRETHVEDALESSVLRVGEAGKKSGGRLLFEQDVLDASRLVKVPVEI